MGAAPERPRIIQAQGSELENMLPRLFFVSRPVALALSVFILLNLLLALQNPRSSATNVWLYLPYFEEPALSVFAGLLGTVLLLPHGLGKFAVMRWLLGGVIFGFCILVGSNVVGYYHNLHEGEFQSDLKLPFSLVILGILLFEFARVSWWIPVEPKMPPPARVFLRGVMLVAAFFFLIFVHIVTYGHTDYRQTADADAAVILGAKVYDDGSLSPALKERLDTGVELFQEDLVTYLIMSGGVGENGVSEAASMSSYAQKNGVPLSNIILDEEGNNTMQSARNCGEIARENGFKRLLTVSQSFHCARIKLTFEREGTHCYTVPAGGPGTGLRRSNFFLLREVFAFPYYLLYHR